ncbi:MAG: hypothetical protein VB120_04250 [Lachnospiraceae bacterium]|nr:hypothetical protein [Lachnospiraceae bacterium]
MSSAKVFAVSLFMGVLSMIVSGTGFFAMFMLASVLYALSASIETAAVIGFVFFIILMFYVRLFPKESLLIPAMLIAYFFKIPYAVPVFAGLYIGLSGIVPVTIGVFLNWFFSYVPELINAAPKESFAPLTIPDSLIKMYEILNEALAKDSSFIFISVSFAVGLVITYAISRLWVNYNRGISIGAGMAAIFVSHVIFGIMGVVLVGFLPFMFGILASFAVVMAIGFFDMVLDYEGSSKVKFEDESNCYYVKVIPKIKN